MTLKTWEKRGKRGLTRAAASVLRARGGAGEPPDLAELSSILLVRQQNQLGDMLLGTPAIRAVRARAPKARIDLICGPQNAHAVLGSVRLDEVLVYDKKAMLARPTLGHRFLSRLRGARYDLALVLSTVSFSYTSAWLAALSGARRRAGRPGPSQEGAAVARSVYHWTLPPPREGRHQTAVNLDLVEPFGAGGDPGCPEIFPSPEEQRNGRAALARAAPAGGGPLVVVHPGAGKKPNRWPAERFGQLGEALRAQGRRVVTCAGSTETDLLQAMDAAGQKEFPRLPPLGWRELAAALSGADLLVANDTGVLHLGAAAGVPTLALFGPTDSRQWCPAAPHVSVLQAPGGDLANLELSRVVDAATGRAPATPAPELSD